MSINAKGTNRIKAFYCFVFFVPFVVLELMKGGPSVFSEKSGLTERK
jgi:hypothetical protein